MGNEVIGTHPEPIPKPVPNVENQFITSFVYVETETLNHFAHTVRVSVFKMTLTYYSSLLSPFISHTLNLSLLHHHSHRSSSSLSWIKHYNIALGGWKILLFLLKELSIARMEMEWVYPNPSKTGMRFDLSSPLDMGRVAGKYMWVGCEDGEGKTILHPASLSCLTLTLILLLDEIYVCLSNHKCIPHKVVKYTRVSSNRRVSVRECSYHFS